MSNRQFQYAPRNFKQSGNNYRGGPMGRPRIPFNQRSFPPYMRPPFGMTADGLCLPSHMQAPPMFGPRGSTIPPRMMGEYKQYSQSSAFPKNDFKQHNAPADNFWCETCDRGFKTSVILENHKAEHQKCGIDGCQFIAHPNVVTKHIQMQHSSGLYNKIRNISTPEDVANWIKERKKNYPSKENIEKRRAQQKECQDRGEKLQPNKSRFNNRKNHDDRQNNKGPKGRDNKPISSFTKKNKNINRLPTKAKTENPASSKTEAAACVEELYCNLKRFRGTSELLRLDLMNDDEKTIADDGIDIEDNEWQEVTVAPDLSKAKSSVCNALGNLINAYDTSSEDDDEPSSKKLITSNIEESHLEHTNSNLNSIPEISVEQISNNTSVSENKEMSINEVSADTHSIDVFCKDKALQEEKDSGPEETGIEKVDGIHNPDINHPQSQGRKRKHSQGTFDKNNETNHKSLPKKEVSSARKIYEPKYFSKRAPNTLLEKLLETDIRHERNLVLQCIHYVIQNNYFMKK